MLRHRRSMKVLLPPGKSPRPARPRPAGHHRSPGTSRRQPDRLRSGLSCRSAALKAPSAPGSSPRPARPWPARHQRSPGASRRQPVRPQSGLSCRPAALKAGTRRRVSFKVSNPINSRRIGPRFRRRRVLRPGRNPKCAAKAGSAGERLTADRKEKQIAKVRNCPDSRLEVGPASHF